MARWVRPVSVSLVAIAVIACAGGDGANRQLQFYSGPSIDLGQQPVAVAAAPPAPEVPTTTIAPRFRGMPAARDGRRGASPHAHMV